MADWLPLFESYLNPSTSVWIVALAIVVGTFILEDATTMLCALAAADGHLYVPLAVGSLFVGIALGDMGLFGLGRLAARHRWARRVIAMDKVKAIQAWMGSQLISAVVSTRFLPGARLPTYSACGFLGLSFYRFALAVVFGTAVWSLLLFTITLGVGDVVMTYLDAWRWPVGIALAVLILGGGRYLARRAGGAGKGESPR